MAHRFNFTGRKRILESQAKIHIQKEAKCLSVVLKQTFSSAAGYSDDDIVSIEAFRRTKIQRKDLGKLGLLSASIPVEFPDFIDADEVYYRIRVVDPETKQLKGFAKRLSRADRETKPGELDSILPVRLSDPEDGLGKRFWKLECSEVDDPVLVISRAKFADFEPVKSSEFKALVWTEVLRQVLTFAFVIHWDGFPGWAKKWTTFTTDNLGCPGAPTEEPDIDKLPNYIIQVTDWIDDAVRSFADHFNLGSVSIKGLTKQED